MPPQIIIRDASSEADFETLRTLLREYAAHLTSLSDGEHICLDSYEAELASLPGIYAAPQGEILLAFIDQEPAGCIALKPLTTANAAERACEMKRLWVRSQFRGMRLGTMLAESLIKRAASRGYTALYLDTMPSTMQPANRIYSKLGFESIDRYQETRSYIVTANTDEIAFFRLNLSAI